MTRRFKRRDKRDQWWRRQRKYLVDARKIKTLPGYRARGLRRRKKR